MAAMARVRAWTAAGAMLLLNGCASQMAPPGGPADVAPPVVLKVSPQNDAVGPAPKSLVLQFNEVISETPKGAKDLADLVFISPKSGTPKVDWNRSRLDIRPAKGWKPNTVYSVVIKRGLQDLRTNGIDSTIQLVFSTGGAIPTTRVTGVAFDWKEGKGLPSALVEAVAPDSTTYQVVADSAGRFVLRYLPPGPYVLRAYGDRNTNRSLDPLEVWDSLSVTLTQSATAEFYGFVHDTVGLRINEVAPQDSGRVLKVTFDKPYAPGRTFVPGDVIIKRADSSVVGVRQVQTVLDRLRADSLLARMRTDSLARIAALRDSTPALRARTDSLARVKQADSVAAVARAVQTEREARRVAAQRSGRAPAPIDTTPPPKMRRPLVYSEIYVRLDSVLPPQTQFRLSVANIRSLSGTVKSPSRTFSTPRPPKADSTAARDSTARRDGAARPSGAAGRDSTARRDTLFRIR
ncbi:MAG: Ig-like domain-containing protein [Gemmatimonadota bacterium]|nr:Ig-like domain-containing protein [Gemmatimonadota bacterium]